ncbi:MAG TPA: hypothetical protein VHA35_05990 [Dongiaceae bacterium]|nr:hypothetical protein [Dongiaceae bacterium]
MTRQNKIAYLTWGCASQITSFQDYAHCLDDMVYLRELETRDLDQYAAVVIPDGMDSGGMRRYAGQLNAYVRNGGFLVAFCCKGIDEWIDVVELNMRPIDAKDWLWWTRPKPYLEIRQPEPKHPLAEAIPLADMSWHWFGVFDHHPAATSALDLDDDSGSLLLDFPKLEGGGRLIVSTLDPHVHNGERFMPATTRFLNAFYPWLNRELGIDRAPRDFTVTYLQCYENSGEWTAPGFADSFADTPGSARLHPLYRLDRAMLAETDILYLPHIHDQFFLRENQGLLLEHLARGGHLVLCSEPAIPWLPFLSAFQAVPPRPFANIKVRLRNDPLGFFRNMDAEFDGWQGIFGQYARGWSTPPAGAVWLTDVGTAEDPKPADWLWQYPTDDGRGGLVFMHNGDNMIRYPDHGPHKQGLVRDICLGLMRYNGAPLNRF